MAVTSGTPDSTSRREQHALAEQAPAVAVAQLQRLGAQVEGAAEAVGGEQVERLEPRLVEACGGAVEGLASGVEL
jgi:hypothetical protein